MEKLISFYSHAIGIFGIFMKFLTKKYKGASGLKLLITFETFIKVFIMHTHFPAKILPASTARSRRHFGSVTSGWGGGAPTRHNPSQNIPASTARSRRHLGALTSGANPPRPALSSWMVFHLFQVYFRSDKKVKHIFRIRKISGIKKVYF